MKDVYPVRRSYHDSCVLLQELGYLEKGKTPPIPDHRPQYDDEEPIGICFFRTCVGETDLENLSLPRTYLARSAVGPISFVNTDFSESTFSWNDFIQVDFTDADLSRSDLRASRFKEVFFVRADLRDADLRHSTFEGCDFTGADMLGTKLAKAQGESLNLSHEQRREIDWQDDDGDEPPGG